MKNLQIALFEEQPALPAKRIVNVASVKQLSPFRYPGGKTWLVPEVKSWLRQKPKTPSHFVELFAGGGIVGLTVAAEGLADHVTMIELDADVASVWQTIFSDEAEWLADRILGYELMLENVKKTLSNSPETIKERAFHTILRNRTCHGGILAPGSGLLKGGENGRGIASRWYPETLAKRIKHLIPLRNKITFLQMDAFQFLEEHRTEDVTYFIDPPYTAPGKSAGKRLYRHFELDHERLFDLCAEANGDFMMTYDDAESVREMAEHRGFKISHIPMKNTHHSEMYELLITPF